MGLTIVFYFHRKENLKVLTKGYSIAGLQMASSCRQQSNPVRSLSLSSFHKLKFLYSLFLSIGTELCHKTSYFKLGKIINSVLVLIVLYLLLSHQAYTVEQ